MGRGTGEANMAEDFKSPDFSSGRVEIRVDDEGVAIYGTREGLRMLAQICEELASRSPDRYGTDHIHLEDRALLTSGSLNAAIAYFD
jgi:hypothetical protein